MTYDKASFLAGLRTGLALPRVPKEKPKAAYLTFLSEDSSEFTLRVTDRMKHWDGTLYYSTDTTNWAIWGGTTTLNSNNGVLYLRGSGNSKITDKPFNDCHWVLTTGKRIQCIGNIENLLDWETVAAGQHPQMATYCYTYMFRTCTSLTSVPELPATTLAGYCYYGLFSGCTSLTSVPELPATSLATYCYYAMFSGCTGLTSAPKLPATALAAFCYYAMFNGCTSLVSAPELPATTLMSSCYDTMFSGCTSLVSAPELPATTLDYQCYFGMFIGCTSLTNAPKLPATTLAAHCYRRMFDGCTSIKLSETSDTTYQYEYRIPTSGTGAPYSTALIDMFANTGGTFTGTPTINTTYYTDHPPVPAA